MVEDLQRRGITLDEAVSLIGGVTVGLQDMLKDGPIEAAAVVEQPLSESEEERIARRNSEVMGLIDGALGI